MNELNLSNKDFGIFSKNPGKTPYELKELGLSGAGFNKLMAQSSTAVTPVADPNLTDNEPETPLPSPESADISDPTPEPEKPAQPKPDILIPKVTEFGGATAPIAAVTAKREKVGTAVLPGQVLVRTPAGSITAMGREFAVRLVQGDNRYSITQ